MSNNRNQPRTSAPLEGKVLPPRRPAPTSAPRRQPATKRRASSSARSLPRVTWLQALTFAIDDPKSSKFMAVVRRAVYSYMPVGVLDDYAPVVGNVDDLPTAMIVTYFIWRVMRYRFRWW